MKNQLIGLTKVYSFTMRMTAGAASWKRTTVGFALVLFLIPLLILTISTALGGGAEEFSGSLTTLYTVDETGPLPGRLRHPHIREKLFWSINYERKSDRPGLL